MSKFKKSVELKKKYYKMWDDLQIENEKSKSQLIQQFGNQDSQTIGQHEIFIENQLNYIHKLRQLTNKYKTDIQSYQQTYQTNISTVGNKTPLIEFLNERDELDRAQKIEDFLNKTSRKATSIINTVGNRIPSSRDEIFINNRNIVRSPEINVDSMDTTDIEGRCHDFISHLTYTNKHFVVLVDGENLIQTSEDVVNRVLQQLSTYLNQFSINPDDPYLKIILVLKRDPLKQSNNDFIQLFLDYFSTSLIVYFVDAPAPKQGEPDTNKIERAGDDFFLLLLFMVIQRHKKMENMENQFEGFVDGFVDGFGDEMINMNMNPILVTGDMLMKKEFYQNINNDQYNMLEVLEYRFWIDDNNRIASDMYYYNLSLPVMLNILVNHLDNDQMENVGEQVVKDIIFYNSLAVLNPYDFKGWTQRLRNRIWKNDPNSLQGDNVALIQKYAITQKNVIQEQQGGSIIPFYW
jgi:hypothetical protein